MDRGAALRATAIFGGLPPSEIDGLASAAIPRSYPKGAFLFREGDPGNAMYVLVRGEIKIGRIGQRGDEVVLGLVKPGDAFGELALFEEEPTRTADAQAIEASECMALGKDALMAFLTRHPEVMRRIIQVLIGYLRDTDTTISETAFLDIPGRVAKKLLELAESHGEPAGGGVRIRLRFTQRTLAGMVGGSRENVNRALSRFERQGLIQRENGFTTILQRGRLRRLC